MHVNSTQVVSILQYGVLLVLGRVLVVRALAIPNHSPRLRKHDRGREPCQLNFVGSDNVDTRASVEYLLPRVKRRDTIEHGTKSSFWVCTRLLTLPPRDAHPVLVADSECFKCVEIRNPLSAVMDGDYRVHKEHLMVYDTSHTVVEWKHVGCEGQVQCGPLEVVLKA